MKPNAANHPILVAFGLLTATAAVGQQVDRVERAPDGLVRLPMRVTGRVEALPDGGVRRQWPGTYFETGFLGREAFFRVGPGEVSLRITLDGGAPVALVRPDPGLYRVTGTGRGRHRLRIDVASESQAGATRFAGIFALPGTRSVPVAGRTRRIEFVGDSHTVGYGNTSDTQACSDAKVWDTTDTSRGIAPLTAARYGADYRVNAISGRGVVRNYGGFAAPTLPQAYGFATFGSTVPANDAGWSPQVIVVALGTNDFSTPLHAGERWPTRAALHADFEAGYQRFVRRLRARSPGAYILLWATDMAQGEIGREAAKVVARLREAGDARVGFVAVTGLSFAGCNAHPDLSDDARIAAALAAHLDARKDVWGRPGARR